MRKDIVLLAKDKPGLQDVLEYLQKNLNKPDAFIGKVGDEFPKKAYERKYDICISFMSPWIVPEDLLKKISGFSINFHPGPPEYRGIGCTNFAIYNNEKEYGVTAHLMVPAVDSGRIVDVRRFPITPADTVFSLTKKCYKQILLQFYHVFDYYLKNNRLPETGEKWGKKLYTREELDDLCRLELDMTEEEVKKRIKATTYPDMPGAFIDFYGFRFVLKGDEDG